HDGSTLWAWIAEKLKEILAQPQRSPSIPPGAFVKVIRRVLDKARRKALAALNIVLAREGWEAFYDERGLGQLRHIATNTIAPIESPPGRLRLQSLSVENSYLPTSTNAPRMN